MVDAIRVTNATKVPSPSINKRYKRREVTGGHGLMVNENGEFNRGTNRIRKTGKYNHLIHPGAYSGPVPPVYGAYLINANGDKDGRRRVTHERFVADLVAYEFLGPPPAGWANTTVIHLDGDLSNAAPDNLKYVIDEEGAELKRLRLIEKIMQGERIGPLRKVCARDPYGTTTRNPYASYRAAINAQVDAVRRELPGVWRECREGADMMRNPPYLPDKPRTLEPVAS